MAVDLELWQNLETLRQKLCNEERIHKLRQHCLDEYLAMSAADFDGPSSQVIPVEENRYDALVKIEKVIEDIIVQLGNNEAPSLRYNSRTSWQNVRFQEGVGLGMVPNEVQTAVKFESIHSVNKFALTLKVLSSMHTLIQKDTYCTKRDMYYENPKLFGSQSCLDNIVDNISCMLQLPRWRLHVLATSKGLMAGNLSFLDAGGNFIDIKQSNGLMVPTHVEGVTSIFMNCSISNMIQFIMNGRWPDLQSDAKFVLVIEKDATFQKLVESGLCQKLDPCILITGKGFPDVNTRLMIRKLWDKLHIPILALVDADPHGIEIMCVYKFGSKSLSFEVPSLAVPSIQWLGVRPTDIDTFHIPTEVQLPLTEADCDKARELLARPYIATQPFWKMEIERMLQRGTKAEIQCFTSVSPNFLADVYLPNKIRFGGWV